MKKFNEEKQNCCDKTLGNREYPHIVNDYSYQTIVLCDDCLMKFVDSLKFWKKEQSK